MGSGVGWGRRRASECGPARTGCRAVVQVGEDALHGDELRDRAASLRPRQLEPPGDGDVLDGNGRLPRSPSRARARGAARARNGGRGGPAGAGGSAPPPRAARPARRLLIGYSYGAYVNLCVARAGARGGAPSVHALALVAPPLAMVSTARHPGRGDFARWPTLLISGDSDDICPVGMLRDCAGDFATELVLLERTGHFLHSRKADVAAKHVVEWIDKLAWAEPGSATPR